MKTIKTLPWISILLILVISAALAAVLVLLGPGGWVLTGWLGEWATAAVGGLLLYWAWRWAGGGRGLAWMIITALVLRLIVGVFLTLALPSLGYDTPEAQAGYLFPDAYSRDAQAWELAQSGQPIWTAFQDEFISDQYGGLLAISAVAYRFLSPDMQRPFLVMLLAALASALAIPFLWKAILPRWGTRTASIAGWIIALYPESLFLNSTAMREPFLLLFCCMVFEALLAWRQNKRHSLVNGVVALIGLMTISWRVGVTVFGFLLVWAWLDYIVAGRDRKWQIAGWLVLAGAAVAMVGLSYAWFFEAAGWDSVLQMRSSGWFQGIIDQFGDNWRIPLATAYGLLQPILPGAIFDDAQPLAHVVTTLRSLGWYAILPLLFYAGLRVWKAQPANERRIMIWIIVFSIIWILISSLRAGGDIWDNPRYRTIWLPWLALIVGWVLDQHAQKPNPWLGRILIIEGIFLIFFSNFYLWRIQISPFRILFLPTIALIAAGAGIVIVWGLIADWQKKLKH
ncbi:MAG TPA: hypothetical protein VN376_03260 [Longilinea sp.]|nr:hypothetical protein [Longilinea sp.]